MLHSYFNFLAIHRHQKNQHFYLVHKIVSLENGQGSCSLFRTASRYTKFLQRDFHIAKTAGSLSYFYPSVGCFVCILAFALLLPSVFHLVLDCFFAIWSFRSMFSPANLNILFHLYDKRSVVRTPYNIWHI